MEWRRILCETNVTPRTIAKVQSALAKAGYNPGSIDGELGSQTHAALKSFQRDHNLAVGGLTYETMQRLGVSL
jgi:peptidoglycan hydrolase-like protein with peptidoglycan-binding domain